MMSLKREAVCGLAGVRLLAATGVVAFGSGLAAAQPDEKAAGTAVLTVGSVEILQSASEVSVPVTLTTNGTSPATIALGIGYNPTKLEFKNVTPGASANAALKDVEANDNPESGMTRFVIVGLNDLVLGDGVLFSVLFGVKQGAATGAVALDGSDPSVANPDALAEAVIVVDGQVNIVCVQRPANVNASDGRTDGVQVTWSAAAGATSYQVYRNTTSDVQSAQTLTGWLQGTYEYLDTDAAAPSAAGGGCFRRLQAESIEYYYWVRSRGASGCTSEYSVPDAGSRSAAKAEVAKGAVVPAALPAKALGGGAREAAPTDCLAVRLTAGEAIDAGTVSGQVVSDGWADSAVFWQGVDSSDGWVVYCPDGAWLPGTALSMSASARTVSGSPVGPVTVEFLVVDDGEALAVKAGAVVQPVLGQDYDAADAEEAYGEASVFVTSDPGIPRLDGGEGPRYRIAPETPFAEPQRVWIPLPAGLDAEDAALCFYDGESWRRAQDVQGWLLPDGMASLEAGGRAYLGIVARHGGTVGLVRVVRATTASLAPSPDSGGVMLLWAAVSVLLALTSLRRLRVRVHTVKTGPRA